ncbi:MAG: DUF3106 domain-containing protein [Bryobacterales bacterium]
MLALVAGFALAAIPPASAQAPRAAKKSIVPRKAARRGPPSAEDFLMRLVEMPPERRREMLANSPRFQRLPPAQRRRILDRVQQIDKMNPEERAALLERYHLFSRLPPEKRERARELYGEWSKLPAARRQMMTRAVGRLRGISLADRAAALESGRGFGVRDDDLALQRAGAQADRRDRRLSARARAMMRRIRARLVAASESQLCIACCLPSSS